MANKIKIELKLEGDFIELFKLLGGSEQQLTDIVNTRALDALAGAKRDVAKDDGRLVGGITLEPAPKEGKGVQELRASVFYAPYVEFGTGSRVFENSPNAKNNYNFNDQERAYAAQFKKSRNIAGQKSQPFLFVNARREQRNITEDVIKFIESRGVKLR